MSSTLYVAAQNVSVELLVVLVDHALVRQFGRGVFMSGLLRCTRYRQTVSYRILWNAACFQDGTPEQRSNGAGISTSGTVHRAVLTCTIPYYPF